MTTTGQKISKQANVFNRLANEASRVSGTASAFTVAVGIVLVWGLTGPVFGYSDTWQLVINTGQPLSHF